MAPSSQRERKVTLVVDRDEEPKKYGGAYDWAREIKWLEREPKFSIPPDPSLDQLRSRIACYAVKIGKEPFAHNIVGILLSTIAGKFGDDEAHRVISDCGLDKKGWSLPDGYKHKRPLEERVLRALRKCWRDLGGAAVGVLPPFVSREHVVEVVLDEDNLERFGGDVEAATWFRGQSRVLRDRLLGKAFRSGRYEP